LEVLLTQHKGTVESGVIKDRTSNTKIALIPGGQEGQRNVRPGLEID